MNVKNFLTVTGIIGLAYGLWFLLGTDHAAGVYGYADAQTDLSRLVLKFFSVSLIASGIMALAARGASKSIGRTAVFLYIAVSQLLFLVFNIMTVSAEGTMGIVDLAVNAILGLGAVYFILQDRKAA